jgi:hypothetical protein
MTYDDLRAALSAYMKRTDPETIANEPTALEMARLAVAQVFFPREAELTVPALAIVGGASPLPTDYGRALAVGDDLEYMPPRVWQLFEGTDTDALAGSYTVLGGQLLVHPSITSLRFSYFGRPQAIIGAASNWLSTNFAPVWLHAARAEQYRFIEDMPSADQADAYWQGLARTFAGESETTRRAGGALKMKGR